VRKNVALQVSSTIEKKESVGGREREREKEKEKEREKESVCVFYLYSVSAPSLYFWGYARVNDQLDTGSTILVYYAI
jgi:hypothetical protein